MLLLLGALQDDEENHVFGSATFKECTFLDEVLFPDVHFSGECNFTGAKFRAGASFTRAQFSEQAIFISATFEANARFSLARFGGRSSFGAARFNLAYFDQCIFSDSTTFIEASASDGFNFVGAEFNGTALLGPLTCGNDLNLSAIAVNAPVTVNASAHRVWCIDSRWNASGTMKLNCFEVDLAQASFTQPVAISSRQVVSPLAADISSRSFSSLQIPTLAGVDCAMLTLADINLWKCQFADALHLDQLRLEGHCEFSMPPLGRRYLFLPFAWTRRQVTMEERCWRAHQPATSLSKMLMPDWGTPLLSPHEIPNLSSLASTYRQLRKGREDSKDEPGAADFYYGEMEMRRHGRRWDEPERWLLQAYWVLSGYGLRASRALVWLAILMLTTILLMMGFGLPQESPRQLATGKVPSGGGNATFTIEKEDPLNPTRERFTGERFDKALSVTFNSVIFRSSGQDLTTAGGYIEMASRFAEPVLLGLAILAIRGRVKR
ncbi:pentapeptide repeat-containing protein [Streptomyces coeruleorubidus]